MEIATGLQKPSDGRKFTISVNDETFSFLLIVLSVIIPITPILSKMIPVPVQLGIIVLWYVDIMLIKRRPIPGGMFALVLLIWVILNVLMKLIGISSAEYGNYFILLSFFDIIVKTIYIQAYYDERKKIKLIRCLQICIVLNVISNIYLGLTYNRIHFLIYWDSQQYSNLNVAMTEFYNMLAIFIGCDLYLISSERNKMWKNVEVISICLSLFFLLSFEPRTIAVTMMIMTVMAVILSKESSQLNRIVILLVIFLLLLIILIIAKDYVISLFPERIALRLRAVFDISDKGIEGTEFLGRFTLIRNSIRTFLNSPRNFLIGIGYHLGRDYYDLVGQHSVITDYLAWYGCIGLAMIVYILRSIKFYMNRFACDVRSKRFASLFSIVFIIASLISNTFRPQVAATAILLVSLCISVSNRVKEY